VILVTCTVALSACFLRFTLFVVLVSYLLYLFACMYLCDAIDGAQFEDPQDQGFEDALE
jgi:hypothetical protein